MTPTEGKAQAAMLGRFQAGYGHSPMLIGWTDDRIRFGVRYSPNRPVHSLTAGAVLAATLEVDTLVYVYEAVRNRTPYLNPLEDPLGQECLFSLAWTSDNEAGWVSVLHREDTGSEWFDEPEEWFDLGGPIDTVIRSGWSKGEPFDGIMAWMQAHQHEVRIYQ